MKALGLAGVVLGGVLLYGDLAWAHDGPEHEIEELTDRIKNEGASADLLLQRAVEYNVLNKGAEAAKDLERALEFEAKSPAIHRELGRAYFALGKTNEALDTLKLGLKHAVSGPEQAAILALRGEIWRARKEHDKALDDLNAAIKAHPSNAEWYFDRSQIEEHLKKKAERIKGLEAGVRETGSGLLEGELIDALIDGGQASTALARVEQELKESRWKGTWFIRRARVFQAMGRNAEAEADAKAAVAELDKRITAAAKDPLLLADRGMAQELLGHKEEARKDFEAAQEKGMSDDWVRERIESLKETEKRTSVRDTEK